jgi:hypothetical protein
VAIITRGVCAFLYRTSDLWKIVNPALYRYRYGTRTGAHAVVVENPKVPRSLYNGTRALLFLVVAFITSQVPIQVGGVSS